MHIQSASEHLVRRHRHGHVDVPSRRRPLASFVSLAVALWACGTYHSIANAAGALPSGGNFIAGTGSISTSATSLTVNQSSTRGVIDWSQFSIASGNRVTFNNGAGATLNRVTGGDPSAIYGTLSATGSVYLINPQGIVIGQSGIVSTGGRFVASTLDTCDCNFMKGSPLTFSGPSNASVVNLGTIGSTGGDVMLIAANRVANSGHITAPQGTAELAVGRSVLLHDSFTGKQLYVETGSGGTIDNEGPITAAQANLQAADGNIYALAGQHTTIRATGTANRDGHIWLVADTGHVAQLGTVIAKNADGSGGTVDASAKTIALGDSAGDRPLVEAAQWNLFAPVYTVGPISADAFQRSLNARTSIILQTTGAQGASGDVTVASNVHWQGPASLTLAAYRNVTLAPHTTIANTGSGNLTLRADAKGIDNGGSVTISGTVDWSRSTGVVSALYDFNGNYNLPGKVLTNQAWTAAPFSGLLTQSTIYQLISSAADFNNANQNSYGVYALGRDVTIPSGGGFGELYGQLDGMGHTVTMSSNLVGVIWQQAVVRNIGVDSINNVDGPRGTTGLVAYANHGTIVNSHSSGEIGGKGTGDWLGGLVGFNDGQIERSWSDAKISGNGGFLGGLVAFNDGTITQSYATGNVSGCSAVAGGLVGKDYGRVSQTYATGAVSAGLGGAAGGLLGNNSSEIGGIHESFATGPVHGVVSADPTQSTLVGGIAAWNPADSIGPDVYWNKDSTGQSQGTGSGQPPVPSANGLTSAQMSQTASFPTYDFRSNGVWEMPAGATHPVLRWQGVH